MPTREPMSNVEFASFVAAMSHLAGMADLIPAEELGHAAAERRDAEDDPQVRGRMEWIRRAAHHLGALQEAVGAYTEIGAHQRTELPTSALVDPWHGRIASVLRPDFGSGHGSAS